MSKGRITVSVDDELLEAAAAAVASGRAPSLSAWVNEALTHHLAREDRVRALADAVVAYEGEHGVMTDDELLSRERADRDAAATRRSRRRSSGAA